jgi:hypothetical protein
MTSKTHIQKDWEQREFIAEMTTNVKKLVDFLNNFGKCFGVVWFLCFAFWVVCRPFGLSFEIKSFTFIYLSFIFFFKYKKIIQHDIVWRFCVNDCRHSSNKSFVTNTINIQTIHQYLNSYF